MIDRAWMGDQIAAMLWSHGKRGPIPGAVILSWCNVLDPFTEDQVEAAVLDYLSTPQAPDGMPWPGEIRARILRQGKVTPNRVVELTAKNALQSVKAIRGSQRARYIAWPRIAGMSLAVKHTGYSLPQIGRAFCRDHTTVIHAKRKAPEYMDRPGFAEIYDAIEADILAMGPT